MNKYSEIIGHRLFDLDELTRQVNDELNISRRHGAQIPTSIMITGSTYCVQKPFYKSVKAIFYGKQALRGIT